MFAGELRIAHAAENLLVYRGELRPKVAEFKITVVPGVQLIRRMPFPVKETFVTP